MSFQSIPKNARPRERLLKHGAAVLTNTELLMIFLRTGIRGCSLYDMANVLLEQYGSITHLARQTPQQLCKIPGLGPAKTAQLLAAFELASRSLQETLEQTPCISSPDTVRQFLGLWLTQRPYELFCILFLDSQNHLICAEELARGSLSESPVYPREVLRRTLHHNAARVIFAHNHPSGNTTPSDSDIHLTITLQTTLQHIDVEVLDHFIVGRNNIVSLKENGDF